MPGLTNYAALIGPGTAGPEPLSSRLSAASQQQYPPGTFITPSDNGGLVGPGAPQSTNANRLTDAGLSIPQSSTPPPWTNPNANGNTPWGNATGQNLPTGVGVLTPVAPPPPAAPTYNAPPPSPNAVTSLNNLIAGVNAAKTK